jgi:hypothetical protein
MPRTRRKVSKQNGTELTAVQLSSYKVILLERREIYYNTPVTYPSLRRGGGGHYQGEPGLSSEIHTMKFAIASLNP